MSENFIFTSSGNRFRLDSPEVSSVNVYDIVRGLGNICRFNGQTNRFYSVAEHSIWCCRMAPPHLKLEALLHDAPEAFYGDLSRPLKEVLAKTDSILFERIDKCVRKALGLNDTIPPEVIEIDNRMLATEARQLMEFDDETLKKLGEPYDIKLWCLEPCLAANVFRMEWHCLDNGIII